MSNIPNILIVDNDSRMCDSLKALLSDRGYVIKTCKSGQEAVECMNRNAFDLVLLDMVMPDLDGLQVMDCINNQSLDILVIVITGHASVESAIGSLRRGAYDFIRKPFKSEELLRVVKNALDYKGLKSEQVRLKDWLKYFLSAVEQSGEGMAIADLDGNLEYLNRAFAKMHGYSSAELAGKNLSIFHAPQQMPYVETAIRQIKETGSFKGEIWHLRRDGTLFPGMMHNSLVRDDEGNPIGMIATLRDISECKQAEEERRVHLHFLESLKQVNHAIQQAGDVKEMLRAVVETTFLVFECDRAWLAYPCDPDAPSFQVTFESARPEFPGAEKLGLTIPMTPHLQSDMADALTSDGPVAFGPGNEKPLSSYTYKKFSIQSQMFISIRPIISSPWMFGMHQCTHTRIWTEQEKRLFNEIGRRVTDGLNNMLYQRELAETKNLLYAVLEQSPIPMAVTDPDTTISIINPACHANLGIEGLDIVGQPLIGVELPWDVYTADGKLLDKGDFPLARAIRGETVTEELFRVVRRDKTSRWVIAFAGPILDDQGKQIAAQVAFPDVTERKQAEEALKEAHNELERKITERTQEYLKANELLEEEIEERKQIEQTLTNRTHDLGERIKELGCLYSISNLVEVPGLSLEELVQRIVDLIPSAMKYPEITCARIIFEGRESRTDNFKETIWKQTIDIIAGEGHFGILEVFHLEKRSEIYEGLFLKEERYLINIIAMVLGRIIERKRIDEELKVSEEKYRNLTENIPDGAYSFNKDGKITAINPQAEKMLGCQSEEIIGNHLSSFVYPQDKNMYLKTFMEGVESHREYIRGLEFRIVSKSDYIRRVEMHSHNQFDEYGNFLKQDGVLRDITETKLLQDKLIRSERLAATGQLAASIAHEINSPLQGISSLLNVMKESHKLDDEQSEYVNLIEGGFESIQNTVTKLLDLNRPGKEKKQSVNVNAIIEDTISLIQGYLKKNKIKVNINLSSKIPKTTASPQQMGQIFLNLINNAVEAMTGGSRSVAGSEQRSKRDREITIETNLRKGNIIISVSDTGPGVSEKDLNHIFDPFYTRKKTMGMGIGLSICSGIIEDHEGTITVKNSPGGGAIFTIVLPVN